MSVQISLLASNGAELSTKVEPILQQFWDVAKILFPIIFAVVAAGIIVKIIMLGFKLAKSSDDPEQRSKVIKGMIWWGVGLLITIAAIAASATIFSVISPGATS